MYYLVKNGSQEGPYPLERLRVMLASGEIKSDTMVWTEGQADWQPVERILGTVQIPAAVPPEVKVARVGVFSFLGGVGMTLAVMGAVLLLLLVIAGGCIGYLAYTGNALDKSSKAYVGEAIPAITTAWLPHELVKRESPAFLKATNDAQLMKLFDSFRKLGALKSYKGCKGEANINYTPSSGKVISATYDAQATFENGEARIKILLIQQNGEWRIQGFRVDSPLFLKIAL